MAITYTLLNKSTEASESVNIKPFTRNAWVKTDSDAVPGAISSHEHKVAGTEPAYPLVRRTSVRASKLFHPSMPSKIRDGKRYATEVYTVQRVDDSVAGTVDFIPVAIKIEIAHGGGVLLNQADLLAFVLSTVAEWWDSVTTGTPDSVVMNKLTLGATDI